MRKTRAIALGGTLAVAMIVIVTVVVFPLAAQVGSCGNGTKDGSEQCDDGNRTSNDGCSAQCVLEVKRQCRFCPSCHNRGVFLAPTQSCGSVGGMDLSEFECRQQQQCPEFCGDKYVDVYYFPDGTSFAYEQCDDGSLCQGGSRSGMLCNNVDTIGICYESGGTCVPQSGDGCNAQCNWEFCGDGITQQGLGEQCDDKGLCMVGTQSNGRVCVPPDTRVVGAYDECQAYGAYCSLRGGDGCSSSCVVESGYSCTGSPSTCVTVCGDGIKAGSEQCDDGNVASGDGCTNACIAERCGDGVVQVGMGEECDGGNANSNTQANACRLTCKRATCGDTVKDTGEQCDDGNVASLDGCNSACGTEFCGDTIQQFELGEECDDGNNANSDGCTGQCKNEYCGDGVPQQTLGEQCDNGSSCQKPSDPNATGIVIIGTVCRSTSECRVCRQLPGLSVKRCGGDPNGIVCVTDAECTTAPFDCLYNTKKDLTCLVDCTKTTPVSSSASVASSAVSSNGPTSSIQPPASSAPGGSSFANSVMLSSAPASSAPPASSTVSFAVSTPLSSQVAQASSPPPSSAAEQFFPSSPREQQPDRPTPAATTSVPSTSVAASSSASAQTVATRLPPPGAFDPGPQMVASSSAPVSSLPTSSQPAVLVAVGQPYCGDGVIQSGEDCDNGQRNSDTRPDACRLNCTQPRCGDFVTDLGRGEECDQGLGNSATLPNRCRHDCAFPFCGDGVQDSGEECDDGNRNDGDGCSTSCIAEQGAVQAGALCGNGVVEAGEECDAGAANALSPAAECFSTCRLPRCGDFVRSLLEQCDDGNSRNGDGCDALCRIEVQTAAPSVGGVTAPPRVTPQPVVPTPIPTPVYPSAPVPQLPVWAQLNALQPATGKRPSVPATGPAAIGVMVAGASAGVAWMRRKRGGR